MSAALEHVASYQVVVGLNPAEYFAFFSSNLSGLSYFLISVDKQIGFAAYMAKASKLDDYVCCLP